MNENSETPVVELYFVGRKCISAFILLLFLLVILSLPFLGKYSLKSEILYCIILGLSFYTAAKFLSMIRNFRISVFTYGIKIKGMGNRIWSPSQILIRSSGKELRVFFRKSESDSWQSAWKTGFTSREYVSGSTVYTLNRPAKKMNMPVEDFIEAVEKTFSEDQISEAKRLFSRYIVDVMRYK